VDFKEEINGGGTTGKWDRMKVAGPGIGEKYKPVECGRERQGKGQMNEEAANDFYPCF